MEDIFENEDFYTKKKDAEQSGFCGQSRTDYKRGEE